MSMHTEKQHASGWFEDLRNQLCAAFEAIEKEGGGSSTFQRTSWERPGGGGGVMAVMKGKVFEKVGVNVSTVSGEFSEEMRKNVPGAEDKPYFWASGVSLVAHMANPHVPAAHMNTRMIVLSNKEQGAEDKGQEATKWWFGGGGDLTPTFPYEEDTADFHGAFKDACDAFDAEYYPKFKAWCDEYFYLKHRDEPRGVGGIFYDYVNTGNWQKDCAFTQAVGKAFLDAYPRIIRRRMGMGWNEAEREALLVKRGRYVEFNLLHDRGTKFGLMTGGNTEAILMSLPPEVKWI